MKYIYKTQGTCSSHIELEIENNIITDIAFWGGCNGNLQGIASLVKGMTIDDVIAKLKGIECGRKGTSCPDQIAIALEKIKKGEI